MKKKRFLTTKDKILHVYNTAGVPQTIVKFLIKKGIKTKLLLRKNCFNAFGEIKESETVSGPVKYFKFVLLFKVIRYKIIHVHAADEFVPLIKFFYPRKKVILTYHGSDIRRRWAEKKRFWEKADLVTVSTKDLLDGASKDVVYTPNIVDTELFKRTVKPISNSALFISFSRFSKNQSKPDKLAEKIAIKEKLSLAVWKRDEWGLIPYNLFIKLLPFFESFIDTRIDHDGKLIPAPSLTALQMLALGGKVFLADKTMQGLPEEHTPEKAIEKWLKIYDTVGNSS